VSVITKTGLGDGFRRAGAAWVHEEPSLARADLEALARRRHREQPLDHVVAVSEPQQVAAARVRAAAGLPGEPSEVVARFRDKLRMREAVRRLGVNQPSFAGVTDPAQVAAFARLHGKVVVKPRLGTASMDVHVTDDPETASRAARLMLASGTPAIVETFVEGPMYHCDSLVVDGEVVRAPVHRYWKQTVAFTTEAWLTASISDRSDVVRETEELNRRVVLGLGLRNGVTHLEAFASPRGVVLCEVAARPGGAGIVPSVHAATGIDMIAAAVRQQTGRSALQTPPPASTTSAGWTLLYRRPGRTTRLLIPDWTAEPWLAHQEVTVRVGERTEAALHSVDGAATFAVTGSSPAEVDRRLSAIMDAVQYETMPD